MRLATRMMLLRSTTAAAVALSGAETLLASETNGLAFDFTDITASQPFGSGVIKDTATPGNAWATSSGVTPFNKLTFARASNATYFDSAGLMQTASSNVARIDYNPSTLAVRGLLMEEARTNLCLRSQEFENASWPAQAVSVSANSVAAPDGTTTADLITETTANDGHFIYQDVGAPSSATNHALSVFMKRGTCDFAFITFRQNVDHFAAAVFNLATGVVSQTVVGATSGTVTSSAIQDVGNGWYRCTLVGLATGTEGLFIIGTCSAATGNTFISAGYPSFVGTSRTLYLWGAQLEAGAF